MSDIQRFPEVMTVHLDHQGPVELRVLTESLDALASYHARFADVSGATINGDAVKLYVKEIRSGSIIVDLVALAQTALPLVGGVNTVVSFAKTLFGVTDYLRGVTAAPPVGTTPRDVRDVSALFDLPAAEPRSVMTISATDGAVVNVTQVFSSDTANAAQNRARNFLAKAEEPATGRHDQQLLYFHQVRGQVASQVGDMAVIQSLFAGAVKTIFASPEVKQPILDDNIFKRFYVVDVDVQSIRGRPRLYRILHVHESFEQDD